ncbi:MAG TPA: hypothetical protein VFI32_04770 [Rhodanobacteraceae bacterium]|nr:hypothetical protein [Rhodanobacteraceae bacterium]
MILRRLTQSLKEQNWTAIVIEFVLLVCGVFLGTQAANWNDERQLQGRRSAALERLHAESEADIAYLRQRLHTLADTAPLRTEALRRLSANDWRGADPGKMADALDSLQLAPAMSPPQGVYDELISTGLYSELGDPRLREAVSTYMSYVAYVQRQIDYVRAGMVARNEGRLFRGAPAVFDPQAYRQVRTVYDFPALSMDREFVERAILNNASMIAQVGWTTRTLAKAKAMCDEISRIDGRPCEAGDVASP